MRGLQRIGTALMATTILTGPALAQEQLLSFSSFGTPGLVDIPTALSAPDGTIAVTLSYGASTLQGTLNFQITERLSGSLRYSSIENWYLEGGAKENTSYRDRSFDVRYQFLDEGRFIPAMSVGLQDFLGTGLYSGEYVVATKHITPRLQATAGLAWGRAATQEGFANPLGLLGDEFKTRDPLNLGRNEGGTLNTGAWFRGDAAVFGGAMWQATDRLNLKVEYSPDPQSVEEQLGNIDVQNPINFGAEYVLSDNISAQGWYRHGDQIGATLSMTLDPQAPAFRSGTHGAPAPVRRREDIRRDTSWSGSMQAQDSLKASLATLLAADGIRLERVRINAEEAEVQIANLRFDAEAEAFGRTVRILSQALPDSVERFIVVFLVEGLPVSQITVARSDVERLEFDVNGAETLLSVASLSDAADNRNTASVLPDIYPRYRWSVSPGFKIATDNRESTGLVSGIRVYADLEAQANLAPGLKASGNIRQFVFGNREFDETPSESALEQVRSNGALYDAGTTPQIRELTLDYAYRPGRDLYARTVGGLLEPMFGGVAGEILWAPVDSPLALGAEVAWVKQRDFDQQFSFQDYETVTGHVSAYYQLTDEFLFQVDAGRYLAEDWGSTLSLTRQFASGWSVGAWATFTDVSFEDFGEGSFDKGIRIEVPFSFFIGQPTRRTHELEFQPVTRDGGARLELDDRLFDRVNDYRQDSLTESWGRVWR